MWEFAKEGVQPLVVLKTRRSLRAVHFQPHGVPLLLTAEVRARGPDLAQLYHKAMLSAPACPEMLVEQNVISSQLGCSNFSKTQSSTGC